MHRILSSILYLTTLGAFAQMSAQAQKGTISGSITAQANGQQQPLPFVNVVIKGTTMGATTDMDGRFSFDADAGMHVLAVSFVGYEPVEQPVTVKPGETTAVNVELSSHAVEMKAMEVVTLRRTDTEGAVLLETRQSEQVVNGIGRQQIAKSQDRTAGDVVKRIPGVTIIGDRFVMIRGLADRYNSVLLNGVTAPSLEADKRAFSFDLLPSGALDNVMIYKSGAPELPGDFAGGVVELNTVNVPAANETRVGYSASFRSGTTFQSFHASDGSPTDVLGFDNGFRQLPDNFPGDLDMVSDPDRLAAAGRSLPNNWTASESTAIPDQRFDLMLARRIGKDDKVRIGNLTAVSYSNTRNTFSARNYNYNAYDPEEQHSDTIYAYSDNENFHTVRFSLLHNWSALIGRTKLEFHNLFTQQGNERTTLRSGRDVEGGYQVKNYAFRYEQRTIYSGQLHGSHDLRPDVSRLEWTIGLGLSKGKEPDYRRVRTVRDINVTEADVPFVLVVPPGATTLDAGRFYSNLDEQVVTGKLDYEQKMSQPEAGTQFTMRGGLFAERKDRLFSARWMAFTMANSAQFDQGLLTTPLDQVFSDEHINGTTGFELEEGTNPSDRYVAANTLLAGYVSASVVIHQLVTISGGVRAENNTQELTSTTYDGRKVNVNDPLLSILPSINASYDLSERALIRAGWSNTVNRPEFRELAPFSFYDFSTNNVLFGNDSLKTATIQNADLRYEFYPSGTEIISAGVFYKQFTDPIEMYFVPGAGSGGTRNFTYRNAPSATALGVEIEVRQSLDLFFTNGHLSRMGVLLNGSLIHSQVQLGEEAKGQSQERPLMGQSPYVMNAGLYYNDPEAKLQYNILYNICGRRLVSVGSVGFSDVYEMPRHSLDMTLSKGLGEHFELKIGAQDVLAQRVRCVQDSDADGHIDDKDEEIQSYRPGRYFTAGFTYKF